MKKYRITYWRSNPQLKNGGYETTSTICAKSMREARKHANTVAGSCVYGGKEVLKIEEVKA